ncbi:MAG: hypothetical protein MSG64_11810 [Pyrinomonadaceae bacterium MAG19_C2-C3]|nr:hypothetical protein [Pyrinomonadaceae bacterium MAG19_C2-C3]
MAHEDTLNHDEENEGKEAGGESLADVVRDEQELPRERLRQELKREPSEEEVNEWLRQHTEGY